MAASSESPVQVTPEPTPAESSSEHYDPALFEHLRTWRRSTAEQANQKAFHVFPDATLTRIATTRPTTLEELEEVKGIGPKKLEQYGQGVLDVILSHQTQEEGEP